MLLQFSPQREEMARFGDQVISPFPGGASLALLPAHAESPHDRGGFSRQDDAGNHHDHESAVGWPEGLTSGRVAEQFV
jgi:hypothetical protein